MEGGRPRSGALDSVAAHDVIVLNSNDPHSDHCCPVVPLRLHACRRRLWRSAPGPPLTQYDHEYLDGIARRHLSRGVHEPEPAGGQPGDRGFSVCPEAHRGFTPRHTLRGSLAAYGTGTCRERRPGAGTGGVRSLQPPHTWGARGAPREICLAVWFSRWGPGGSLQHQWPPGRDLWDAPPVVARPFSRHPAVLL